MQKRTSASIEEVDHNNWPVNLSVMTSQNWPESPRFTRYCVTICDFKNSNKIVVIVWLSSNVENLQIRSLSSIKEVDHNNWPVNLSVVTSQNWPESSRFARYLQLWKLKLNRCYCLIKSKCRQCAGKVLSFNWRGWSQ